MERTEIKGIARPTFDVLRTVLHLAGAFVGASIRFLYRQGPPASADLET